MAGVHMAVYTRLAFATLWLWSCSGLRRDSREADERLPICHEAIVLETCASLKDDPSDSSDVIEVKKLAEILAASPSDMSKLMDALNIEHASVKCHVLCDKVAEYVTKIGGTLPPTSDTVCLTIAGKTSCDEAVDPEHLTAQLATIIDTYHPDIGIGGAVLVDEPSDQPAKMESSLARLSQTFAAVHRRAHALGAEDKDEYCPHTVWDTVEGIAALFRFYPSSGQDNIYHHHHLPENKTSGALLETESSSASDQKSIVASQQDQVNSAFAQAKSWVGLVIKEMNARKTRSFLERWFGGFEESGRLSLDEVRTRVLRTYNFLARELHQGVHFVYPADSIEHKGKKVCIEGVFAFVFRNRTESGQYEETASPICSSSSPTDAFTKHCGVDDNGKMYVHFCSYQFEFDINHFTASVIHELTHHAGPRDFAYAREEIRWLEQSHQLYNAESYVAFGVDVTGSCVDTAPNCSTLKSACATSYKVKVACRRTCGVCDEGIIDCHDENSTRCAYHVQDGACSHEWGREECPKTCGVCGLDGGGAVPSLPGSSTTPPAESSQTPLPEGGPTHITPPTSPPVEAPPFPVCEDASSLCRWLSRRFCGWSFVKKKCRKTCKSC